MTSYIVDVVYEDDTIRRLVDTPTELGRCLYLVQQDATNHPSDVYHSVRWVESLKRMYVVNNGREYQIIQVADATPEKAE